jgi:serine/threonine-protein kinase
VASGEVIDGYRMRGHLQTGQSSQVYEVVELTSNRHFAMKILLPEAAHDPEHRKTLFHEARVGILLKHPNIIRIVKISENKAIPYFVMEYFPSGSLRNRLLNKQFDFIKEHAHSIFRQAATGLAYMNGSGWLHRDVKPDNMLVNSSGEMRIIDFAIAERINTGFFGKLLQRKQKAQGTRSYMSPEQIRGKTLDTRADIYSFGASLYELTTGRPPFRGQTNQDLLNKHILEKPLSPAIHNPELTDNFCALVLRMLAKKKEERPRDFHEVLMAIRSTRIYKDQPIKSTTESF